jgi:hypothetical protein
MKWFQRQARRSAKFFVYTGIGKGGLSRNLPSLSTASSVVALTCLHHFAKPVQVALASHAR